MGNDFFARYLKLIKAFWRPSSGFLGVKNEVKIEVSES